MIKRLRWKFVAIIMAIVLAMLVVIFGLVYQNTKENLEADSIRTLEEIAQNSAFFGGMPGQNDQVRLPYFTLQISSRGTILAIGGDDFDLSNEEYLRTIIDAALTSPEQTGVLEEYSLRFLRSMTPAGLSLIYADISMERSLLDNLVKNCLLIGAAALLVLFGLSVLFARWAVKPVERAWEQQRQFVADASHELKTPLTVILTNAELLQSPDQDGETKDRFAGSILTMSHQMRGLVEQLLELARVDNGNVRKAMEQLDLSALTEDAVLPFEALLFEQELLLETEVEVGIGLRGSRSHLRQLVEIFLDNAQKYASKPGRVLVRLKRQGGHCLLSVANTGPAMEKEDLKNIFKRFYRADKARAMNHSYGLGLAIAAEIVKEHRGRIWAESAGGWNTFYVQLPVSAASGK